MILVVDWSEDYEVPYGMMLGRDDTGAPGPVRSASATIGCLTQTLKMARHQLGLLDSQVRELVELANMLGKDLYAETQRAAKNPPATTPREPE